MITWIFVLVVLHAGSANAGSVGFYSAESCVAYANAVLSRPDNKAAEIRVAECIGLRNGVVLEIKENK